MSRLLVQIYDHIRVLSTGFVLSCLIARVVVPDTCTLGICEHGIVRKLSNCGSCISSWEDGSKSSALGIHIILDMLKKVTEPEFELDPCRGDGSHALTAVARKVGNKRVSSVGRTERAL